MTESTTIVGVGHYLPEGNLDNATVEEWTGKSSSWTDAKTGIAARPYARDGETVVEMAAQAVEKALDVAGLNADDLEGVICSTSTPTRLIPSTASELAASLGIDRTGPTFDVNAVCSGWIFAACIGDSLLSSGTIRGPLAVVATDAYSRIMNRDDPTTVSLFGDGAACAILKATAGPNRILGASMKSAPSGWDHVKTQEHLVGTSIPVERPVFQMNGKMVVSLAHELVPDALNEALKRAQLDADDIDHFIFHQGNVRMVTGLADTLNLPPDKVHIFSQETGNLASASAPTTLSQTSEKGLLSPGDTVALITIGGGITVGAMVMKWGI